MNLNRILAAVGTLPSGLNKAQLAADLDGIAGLYPTGVDAPTTPKEHRESIGEIIETAEHLKMLINQNAHLWRNDFRLWQHHPALDRLIADARARFPEQLTAMLDGGRFSAFDNLVGNMLRCTYELHFKEKADYTRNDGGEEVSGAFIDFAEAALQELGITTAAGDRYSRQSIAAALARAKT